MSDPIVNSHVVLLLVGRTPPEDVAVLLSELLTGPDTVAVVSTDLSHYLDQDQARLRDARTVEAILAHDPDALRPDDACGFHPLRELLRHAADQMLDLQLLRHATSADIDADLHRVVGYGSFLLAA